LKVRNEEGQTIEQSAEFTSMAGANWKELKLAITITEDWLNYADLEDVIVTLTGSERQFWAGHYGIKFSRAYLKIEFIPPGGAVEVAEDNDDAYTVNIVTKTGDEFL
jgi:hypothetical protein